MTKLNMVNFRHSVATQLLASVFSVYLLIAVTVTVVHMAAEYFNTQSAIEQDLQVLNKTFSPGLAPSLWNADVDQVQITLQGLMEVPILVGAKVEMPDYGMVASAGTYLDENNNPIGTSRTGVFGQSFSIQWEGSYVGTLVLYSNTDVVIEKVKLGFLFIIVNSIIKTVALWMIFFICSRKLLSSPLTRLTHATEQLDTEAASPLAIDIGVVQRNELQTLQHAFNKMAERLWSTQHKLHNSLKQVEDANRRLHLLLESTQILLRSPDPYMVLIHSIQTLLKTQVFENSLTVNLVFREPDSTSQHPMYRHFCMPMEINKEGKLLPAQQGLQDLKSFSAPVIRPMRDFPLDTIHVTESVVFDDTLFIPIRLDAELFGLIELQGVKQAFEESDKEFLDTLTHILTLVLSGMKRVSPAQATDSQNNLETPLKNNVKADLETDLKNNSETDLKNNSETDLNTDKVGSPKLPE